MIKNNPKASRIFKSLTLLSVSTISAVSIASVVSCSSSSSARTSEIKFNTKTTLKSKAIPSGEYNVYQANENLDAQKKLDDFIRDNLTVQNLQKEFNLLLTDFYESYEYENNVSEIEIERIKVIKRNEINGQYSFDIEVFYEQDFERDRDEQVSSKVIKWTPKILLISHEEIEEIKQQIKSLTETSKEGIDLEDIKEIFFGEKFDNDFDDRGVFDKIALLNKDYKNLAYLLCYELSLNDIFGQLGVKVRTGVNLNTKFKIPSLILNSAATLFVPNNAPDINFAQRLDLTTQKLDEIFKSEITTITSQQEIVTKLNELLKTPLKVDDLTGAKEISQIQLQKILDPSTSETKYVLIVHYKLAKKIPDLIYFYPTAK